MKLIVFQLWLTMSALTHFALAVKGSSEASPKLRNNADHEEYLSILDIIVEQENNDPSDSRTLFGGEDFINGPWYHEVFSRNACKNYGLPDDVADEIAWHADYTDSYAYNPLYWFDTPEFIHRFKSAKSLSPDLAKVHHDDLFTTAQVITAYYRYTKGCLLGLKWAAEIYDGAWKESDDFDPIGAAHNILGVTFHATQDFYSHSNWIDDPNRRDKIFWDLGKCALEDEFLYTGSYEEENGIKEHGKYSILCSITEGWDDISWTLDLFCGVDLTSDSDICREYKDCGNPASVTGGQVLGIKIPDNTLYFAPPGINLDNTWQAEIGAQVREIEISGAMAFNISGDLAIKASSKLLAIAEKFMNSQGHTRFWSAVTSSVSRTPKENEFEYFNHFPFQFISAGPYPVETDDEGVYLRITLKTSTDALSGTDAPIKVLGEGKEFTLDYMPGADPLIGYNDFENGDETVYTVGPFNTLPSSIQIKNDAPDFTDVFASLGNDITNFLVDLGTSIKDFFLNQADYVGSGSFVMQSSYFDNLSMGIASEHKIYVDGGSEGKYDIYFQVKKLSESSTDYTFEVKILRLHCKNECSGFLCDGGTSSDEPFLLAVLSSFPGNTQSKLSGPFNDVDSGETRDINHVFSQITFTKPRGAMTLAFQIWESDNEPASEREDALRKMAGDISKDTSPNSGFFTKIGEAVAADWKLDWIRVYAFSRGESLRSGLVLFDDTDHWIESGESRTFNLDPSKFISLGSLNYEPKAICKNVYKRAHEEFCGIYADATAFDGDSTDPECDALSFSVEPGGPYGLGDTAVLLTVTDSVGNTDQCITKITVVDMTPPTISGCSSVEVECSTQGGTPMEDIQLVSFFNAVVSADACDEEPIIEYSAPNQFLVNVETMVKFSATDIAGNSESCVGSVLAIDTMAPSISTSISNIILWPPNRKYFTFDILTDYGVVSSDVCCGSNNTLFITEVSSNESNQSISITGPTGFKVLSHRHGSGNGRNYTIKFDVIDCSGLVASSQVYVTVPKRMAKPYWVLVDNKNSKDIGIITMNRIFSLKTIGTSLSIRFEASSNVDDTIFRWIENGIAKEKRENIVPFYMGGNYESNIFPVTYLASTGIKMVNTTMIDKSNKVIRTSTISFQIIP